MVLRREIQELANALKSTREYTEMMGLRRKIMSNPALGRLMAGFEREHIRIINLDLPDEDITANLNKLYSDYKDFLEKQEVKDYIKATQNYQKVIAENIDYLNRLLDARNAGT